MSDSQLIDFYLRNQALFHNNDIVTYTFKSAAWWIFKSLIWVADKCESLYDISFGMVDFTTWSNVNGFTQALKPLFIALFAASLLGLGLILIFAHEKKPKIMMNICVAVLCVTSSFVVFSALNTIAKDLKEGFESIGTVEDSFDGVYEIASDNLLDIVFLDQTIGMENIDYEENNKDFPHPNITAETFELINYVEVLNPKSDAYEWTDQNQSEDILSKMIMIERYGVNEDNTYKIIDLYNGFGWNDGDDADFGNQFYYRYEFNFFTAFLQVLAIIILYVAMSYKCVRIAFELVVSRLLAYLYSAEIHGGQKIGKILIFIRDNYILLLITTISIRIFYLLNSYILETIDNTFVQGVLILFAAFCVIDGPNLAEKLIGLDAGLSSSTARIMAAYGFFRGAAGGVKNAGKGAYKGGKFISDKVKDHKAKKAMEESAMAPSGRMGSDHSSENNKSGQDKAASENGKNGKKGSGTEENHSKQGRVPKGKEEQAQQEYMGKELKQKEKENYMDQKTPRNFSARDDASYDQGRRQGSYSEAPKERKSSYTKKETKYDGVLTKNKKKGK